MHEEQAKRPLADSELGAVVGGTGPVQGCQARLSDSNENFNAEIAAAAAAFADSTVALDHPDHIRIEQAQWGPPAQTQWTPPADVDIPLEDILILDT